MVLKWRVGIVVPSRVIVEVLPRSRPTPGRVAAAVCHFVGHGGWEMVSVRVGVDEMRCGRCGATAGRLAVDRATGEAGRSHR